MAIEWHTIIGFMVGFIMGSAGTLWGVYKYLKDQNDA